MHPSIHPPTGHLERDGKSKFIRSMIETGLAGGRQVQRPSFFFSSSLSLSPSLSLSSLLFGGDREFFLARSPDDDDDLIARAQRGGCPASLFLSLSVI